MAVARRVVIPYAPRRAFMPFHERRQRWAVLVAHRRAGKTVSCVNDLIRAAITLDRPEGRFAYIAPLYIQAKDVAWVYLKRFAAPLLAAPPNESELRVDLLNGSRIRLYGADNPDRLRGLYLDGVVLDEYADMHPGMWGEVIRPALADRQGWATFIGTPKGRNAFFDLFERAKKRPEEWFADRLRASETGLLAASELDAAREEMTLEQYEQEFECSFDAAITGAYYGREMADAERERRICEVPFSVDRPVHRAWDLGVQDATAIWFFQVVERTLHIVDYYEATGFGAQHFVQELRARERRDGYVGGQDFVPHDSRMREYLDGTVPRQRLEVMRAMGLDLRVVPNHRVPDGINALRVTLPRCRFDADRCRDGIEALRQYRTEWDDKARVFRDKPKHDWTSHAADAARYMAMAWRELTPAETPRTHAERMAEVVRKPTLDEMIAAHEAEQEEW